MTAFSLDSADKKAAQSLARLGRFAFGLSTGTISKAAYPATPVSADSAFSQNCGNLLQIISAFLTDS